MNQELKDLLKNLERYKNFTLLEDAVAFNEFFAGKDIPVVQIHDATTIGSDHDDILGFCGVFAWENNKIQALDGDSYTADMQMIGYNWFEADGRKCLDILVTPGSW